MRHGTEASANSFISSGTYSKNGERAHDCTTLTNSSYDVRSPATSHVPLTT